jgi:inner membrane transporter RhtA
VPAPLFFIVGAISQYLGAALAVDLFSRLPPSAVAWLRVGFSGGVLWLWRLQRRHRRGAAPRRAAGRRRPTGTSSTGWSSWGRAERRAVVIFGAALAGMNLCFYLAVERLPLGTAVAIEFTGPIAVAAFGTRSARNVAGLGLASAGVLLLADVQWEASAAGVIAALAAAALWAVYIVVGSRVAGSVTGSDGLAWALLVGTVVISPFGVAGLVAGSPTLAVVAACAVVGILSNVVPYSLDQLVLPRLSPSQFALLLSLLPATAAVVGAVLLGQHPTPPEVVGIALVIGAVLVRAPS